MSEARFWAAKAERAELELAVRRGELERRDLIDSTLFEGGRKVRDATLMALDRAALSLLHQSDLAVVRRLLRAVYRDALHVMDKASGEAIASTPAEGAA